MIINRVEFINKGENSQVGIHQNLYFHYKFFKLQLQISKYQNKLRKCKKVDIKTKFKMKRNISTDINCLSATIHHVCV